ncbi:MAG: hypothetical protein WD771_09270 [Gemmatimonadaceae bacterium]
MPIPLERLTAALADRYRIERELGQGGMATVYPAAIVAAEIRTAPTLSVGRRQVLHSATEPFFEVAPSDERFLRFWARMSADSINTDLVLIQNVLGALRGKR